MNQTKRVIRVMIWLALCGGVICRGSIGYAQPERSEENQIQPVQVCLASDSEWVPYTYFSRGATGQIEQNSVEGASVEFMKKVFAHAGLPYEIKYLPWIRVQASLRNSDSAVPCEVTWDVAKVEGREKWLYFSLPVYKTRAGLFFSRKNNPQPFSFSKVVQLLSYKICGISSYDYGILEPAIDIKVNREQQALDLVKIGRCDFFYSSIEPIVEGGKIGIYQVASELDFTVLPLVDSRWYTVVSRASPRSDQLFNALNQSIRQLSDAGVVEEIYSKYISGGRGLSE